MAATPNKSGGYDYNFVKEPPDTTICVICQLPSRDPYLSVCCGHLFCKSCLDNAKKAANVVDANCPMCRSEDFVTFPNKQMDRLVRSLHVYCTNKEKGCKWQGEVNYISGHLRRSDGCDFEDVQCSNKCGEIIQRQYLVGHMETECPRHMVTCQYCGVDGEYQLIDGEHKELCSKFPLPCPNKCDVGSVPRQDMTEHRKMCPLEEVECSNKCGKILQRQYLDSHLETKCPRRIVNCQYCQLTGEHQFIEGQHKEQCPKFPLPCPNKCDSELKVSREDMDRHRKECRLETVQCQYQCVGCDDVMVRKHQREHNKENMEEHLALVVSELVTLQLNTQRDLVTVKQELVGAKLKAAKTEDALQQRLAKTEQDLSLTQQELADTKLDALQEINNLKKKSEDELQTVKQELATSKLNAAKIERELKQELTKMEKDLMNVRQTATKTEDTLQQKLARTQQDLAATKKELVSVKTAKDQLAQKLTKTENDIWKELTTTKHRSSVAYAEILVTKCRLLPCDELTKMLTSLQENIDNVNQMYKHVENLKDKTKHEVASVDEYISERIGELQMVRHNAGVFGFLMRKKRVQTDIIQTINTISSGVVKSQTQLLEKVTQVEKDLTGIYQQLDDLKVTAAPHITAINELIPQVDNLIKDLTTYSEHNVIEKLNTVKTDMKLKTEMLQLAKKRKDVDNIKKRMETVKGHITATAKDLLQQLSDKHVKAKQTIDQMKI